MSNALQQYNEQDQSRNLCFLAAQLLYLHASLSCREERGRGREAGELPLTENSPWLGREGAYLLKGCA